MVGQLPGGFVPCQAECCGEADRSLANILTECIIHCNLEICDCDRTLERTKEFLAPWHLSSFDDTVSRLHEIRQQPTPTRGDVLLSLNHISKTYAGRVVLDGIDLAINSGEVVALVGENGTGKSTLMKICAGLLAPTTGQVEWKGRVGYCPQTPGLMNLLTAQEHLDLFDLAPTLTLGGGGDRILTTLGFPMTQVRTKLAKDLSGGTQQKLNLALAMLGDADILLLDEPYQGFDQGSYLNFWDFAERWRADGRAVIVVTHLLTELERVDRVVELRSDELVGSRR